MWLLTDHAIDLDNENRDDGGPNCYAELTNTFRIGVSVVSLLYHLILLKTTTLPFIQKHQANYKEREPSWLERTVGYVEILTFLA
jgi:hypothetical protein